MKKQNILLLFSLLFLYSCEKEEKVIIPVAQFIVSATEVSVNETVTFEYTGEGAKQVVIYTGDEGHNYDLKALSNTGLVMNKGILTYSYKTPGQYKAVLLASNYDKEGKQILFDTAEIDIRVVDNGTALRYVYLKRDVYNKEISGQITGNHILFAVPYKVRISGRDIAVNIERQRIDIAAFSDAAIITVDGEEYVSTPASRLINYDLTKPHVVKVISDAGDTQEHEIKALHYPIFETFSINGVQGSVAECSDFDFDKMYVTVTLPPGTDRTALVPTFGSADAEIIKIGDVEQVSGVNAVNFTNPVTYTLKTWIPEFEDTLWCESEMIVTVE